MDIPGAGFLSCPAGFSCARPTEPSAIAPARKPVPNLSAKVMFILFIRRALCALCVEFPCCLTSRLMMMFLFNALASGFSPRHHFLVLLVWQHAHQSHHPHHPCA